MEIYIAHYARPLNALNMLIGREKEGVFNNCPKAAVLTEGSRRSFGQYIARLYADEWPAKLNYWY